MVKRTTSSARLRAMGPKIVRVKDFSDGLVELGFEGMFRDDRCDSGKASRFGRVLP